MKLRVRNQIMNSVYSKYVLMRVQMKLSYEAYMINFTVSELWLRTIISSFKFLRDSGQILVNKKKSLESEFIYQEVLNNSYNACFKMLLDFN